MPTISNQISSNLKASHISNVEALNSNQPIQNDQKSESAWSTNVIENFHKKIKSYEPKKNFSATVLDTTSLESPHPKKKAYDKDFCIKTYLQQYEERMKKFDDEEVKYGTPFKAALNGAIYGAGLGIALFFLIFATKKIIASAIIMNLIQNNQYFFRK